MKKLPAGFQGVAFALGGLITYIINVVDTWQGHNSVVVKLLLNLTLDAFLAFIWPVTWILWLVMYLAGNETSFSRVLGL